MKRYLFQKIKEIVRQEYKTEVEEFQVEPPRQEELGDLATNVAFILSKTLRRNPQEIAQYLANLLTQHGFDATAQRGFINIRILESTVKEMTKQILQEGESFFLEKVGEGKRILVELVSANPTGPLHLGHGRIAVVGDVIARLLTAFGFDVTREYYINDAGRQVYLLGLSILYRCLEMTGRDPEDIRPTFEEEGYKGTYVMDLAKEALQIYGEELFKGDREETIRTLSQLGIRKILEEISQTLSKLDVSIDSWFSERSLVEEGRVEEVLSVLQEKGYLYEKDGAIWFKSTLFGDDKDRVLRKSTGEYTYFATDIAYHYEKYKRGYQQVVNVWGADHHGYLPRLVGALKALGIPDQWLRVEWVQMVRLFKGEEEVRMSKRAGEFVTLEELMEEVGKDAVRFIFLTRRSDTPLDFDIQLALEKSSENPVFYVQYAHARIRGVFREVKTRYGIDPDNADLGEHIQNLRDEAGIKLCKKCIFLKDTLWDAVSKLAPHIITSWLIETAKDFHNYYNHHRVMVEDRELMLSRLAVLKTVEISLKTALNLIGVSAPERM